MDTRTMKHVGLGGGKIDHFYRIRRTSYNTLISIEPAQNLKKRIFPFIFTVYSPDTGVTNENIST